MPDLGRSREFLPGAYARQPIQVVIVLRTLVQMQLAVLDAFNKNPSIAGIGQNRH